MRSAISIAIQSAIIRAGTSTGSGSNRSRNDEKRKRESARGGANRRFRNIGEDNGVCAPEVSGTLCLLEGGYGLSFFYSIKLRYGAQSVTKMQIV